MIRQRMQVTKVPQGNVAPVDPVAPAGSPVQAEAGAGTEAPPALSTASHRFKVAFVFLVALSVYGFAHVTLSSRYEESDDPRVTVWWYGWLTAASTGLGVVPFLFVREMGPLWLGRCNGLAAGMMLSASMLLLFEGMESSEHEVRSLWHPHLVGCIGGVAFIFASKRWLGHHEHLKFSGMEGAGAQRMLLIIAVMFLHSISEGVGIGVAFASASGHKFGVFITATLAVHNIPEGLAIALVLIPRKVHVIDTAVWSVFTSLPQPLMAVLAFHFTQQMIALLPLGLGFAAGAMIWVSLFDLYPEAKETLGGKVALVTTATSFLAFSLLQAALKGYS